MSDGSRIPNISTNNEVNGHNQNMMQNNAGQENHSVPFPDTIVYGPCPRDSTGRPVLIREPERVNVNLDTSNMFGELSLNDILGQGNAQSDFSSLLETGRNFFSFLVNFLCVSFLHAYNLSSRTRTGRCKC